MTHRLRVRDLKPADALAWRGLYLEYLQPHALGRANAMADNAWSVFQVGDPLSVFKVCESDGSIVGLANATLTTDIAYAGSQCSIQDLFVAPASRRIGVASALLYWFRDEMRAQGWTQISWFAAAENEAAKSVYRRIAADSEDSVRFAIWNAD